MGQVLSRFDVVSRRAYLGVVCLGLTALSLCPAWRGQAYTERFPPTRPPQWRPNGLYGLETTFPATYQSPLWDPPKPRFQWDLDRRELFRFPWEPVTQQAHIEIDWQAQIYLATTVVAATGLLLRFVYLAARRRATTLVTFAWSIAAGVIVADVLLFVGVLLTWGKFISEFPMLARTGPLIGAAVGALCAGTWVRLTSDREPAAIVQSP